MWVLGVGCVVLLRPESGERGLRAGEQERVTVCKVACFIATPRIALDERRNGVVRRPPRQNVGSKERARKSEIEREREHRGYRVPHYNCD